MMLGNSESPMMQPNQPCGACPNCTINANLLFPSISKIGCRTILMDLFVTGNNTMMIKERTEQTLEKAMVAYPNINSLLFDSNAARVVPSKIKDTNFILIAADIIGLKYMNKEVHLQLAMSKLANSTDVAMNDEYVWDTIRQK